jgi:hypothetical protein
LYRHEKTTKRQHDHAFCSEVTLPGGFALKHFVVKNEPQKINARRFIRRTLNIENPASQTRRKRRFATGLHAALGELKLGPHKTRPLPNLVQVVF